MLENEYIENNKMTIISNEGAAEEVEIILAFSFKDNQKEYIVYTKNEKDENDNITVYVSNVEHTADKIKLLGVADEEEWNKIKDVLRELSKTE